MRVSSLAAANSAAHVEKKADFPFTTTHHSSPQFTKQVNSPCSLTASKSRGGHWRVYFVAPLACIEMTIVLLGYTRTPPDPFASGRAPQCTQLIETVLLELYLFEGGGLKWRLRKGLVWVQTSLIQTCSADPVSC